MLMRRRLAPIILGTLVIACGDGSTGPGAVDLRLAASSFNDLGLSRRRAGDGSGAGASQAAALALRAGVRPARVRIAIDGVTEDYWALEIERGFAGGIRMLSTAPDPLVGRTLVAWRGGPVERVVSFTIMSDTGTFSLMRYYGLGALPPDRILFDPAFGVMFERGGPAHLSVDGGARSTRESLGSECEAPQRSILNMLSSFYLPETCQRAVFFTRFNMRVQEWTSAGLDAARSRVVEMAGHEVPGIRLEYQPIERPCPVCD